MIVITGEIEFHPEDAWPAMGAALKMMEASAAEEGCYVYQFSSDLTNLRCFRIYEEWRDEAALKAHNESAHMAAFQAKLGELRILRRRLYRMKVDVVTPL